MPGAFVDQFRITDADPIRGLHHAVAAVQAVIQNPGQVVTMDDTPDQRLFRIELGVEHQMNILSLSPTS